MVKTPGHLIVEKKRCQGETGEGKKAIEFFREMD
jgi:hypothetical protein